MKSLENYLAGFNSPYSVFDQATALSIYKPRDPFAHKGTYGHVLLLAGSYGKMGAAVMASAACLTTGAGLLTTHLPACGYQIMQTSLPEAMVSIDENEVHLTSHPPHLEIYQAAAVGPGIGTDQHTKSMITVFLAEFEKPLVIDADALNILATMPDLLKILRPGTVITPHPKEFDRLFGPCQDDCVRLERAEKKAKELRITIVLKGHFTGVFSSGGKISFNTSGNAGMAKGGSGDVLTGMIAALLAQQYEPFIAAQLGVYLHGAAGDEAARIFSEEAMLPTNLIACIGKIFLQWKSKQQTP